MLPPEQIDALNVLIPDMVSPITDFLIQDIARRVAEAGQFTSTAAYQLWKIQKLGLSRKQALKELKKQLGLTEDELNSLIQEAAEQGYAYDLKRLGVKAVSFAENENLQQIVNAAVKLADKDFENITQSLGMIDPMGRVMPLKDIYNSCCDFAFNSVQTGATDVETAVRRACRELANKGLRTIDYESGIHTSLEAAVRRNIMGGLGLMGEKISEENHDKLGADGWEISAHAMCAPDHEAIQGKQFTNKEFTKLNEGLKRRIGTLNCGHVKTPIFIGISKPVYTDKQLEQFKKDNAKGVDYEGRHFETQYDAVQFQKYIERSIRTQERRILTAKATGDKDYLQKCEVKYRVLTAEYNKFSKAVGLKTRHERLFVAGFSNSRKTGKQKIKKRSKIDEKKLSDIKANYVPYAYGQITRREAGTIYRAMKEEKIKVLPETIKSLYDQTESYIRFARERYNQDYLSYDRIYNVTALIQAGEYEAAQEILEKWEADRIKRAGKKSIFYKYQKK